MERELRDTGIRMWVEAASAVDDRRAWRGEHAVQLSTRRIWQMVIMIFKTNIFIYVSVFVQVIN